MYFAAAFTFFVRLTQDGLIRLKESRNVEKKETSREAFFLSHQSFSRFQSGRDICTMNTSISSSVDELIGEERPAWLDLFLKVSQFYTIPILCCCGIIFNCSSVGVLLSNILHLHRSLVVLFSFLNISDT